MSRAVVEIDLNSRDAQGLTPVRLAKCNDTLHIGQIVTAVEREDGVQARGYVAEVDERLGYAFLHIDENSMTELGDPSFESQKNVAVNRAVASVQNAAAAAAASSTSARAVARMFFTS